MPPVPPLQLQDIILRLRRRLELICPLGLRTENSQVL